MAIPAKPTARLAEDNVFGQKTRDAACYWAQADRVTVGTGIASMGSPFLRRWQEMLNRALRGLQEFPQLKVGPYANQCESIPSFIGGYLTTDGSWGPKTRTANGGWVAYYAAGFRNCGGMTYAECNDYWGTNTYELQRALNRVIFG